MISPQPNLRPSSALRNLLTHEAAGGLILIASTMAALAVANSPAATPYAAALERHAFGLSVLHWINDGLMALLSAIAGWAVLRSCPTPGVRGRGRG
jgi:NhaA family Na+:H+ antiporter